MDQRHAIDFADQPVDDAIVDIEVTPASVPYARQRRTTSWIGNGEIAGPRIVQDTIGLAARSAMPPQIMIAIEPARACDPMDECRRSALRLLLNMASWSTMAPGGSAATCPPRKIRRPAELRLPQGGMTASATSTAPHVEPLRQLHNRPTATVKKFAQRCGPQEG
jgi:hypothetical protein